jgi:hypothetical protein
MTTGASMNQQDHVFINRLVELYGELPESDPSMASRRTAILVEMLIKQLEAKGMPVTTQSLRELIEQVIIRHRKPPNSAKSAGFSMRYAPMLK